MAHKKGQGSTKNGRDSNPQYRGIKLYGGQIAQPGSIIVRQVGTPFQAGFNVRRAKDDSLFAVADGVGGRAGGSKASSTAVGCDVTPISIHDSNDSSQSIVNDSVPWSSTTYDYSCDPRFDRTTCSCCSKSDSPNPHGGAKRSTMPRTPTCCRL